jgi:hypothetical protein
MDVELSNLSIKDIEAEILSYQAHIQALYDRRRALLENNVSINRLSDDIFSAMFTCYRDICIDQDHDLSLHLVRLTSVCARWRNLALGNPNLWTYIQNSQFNIVELHLTRSQKLPLSLVYQEQQTDVHPWGFCDRDPVMAGLRRAILEIHRIKHLHVEISAAMLDQFLITPQTTGASCTAPLLRFLRLDIRKSPRAAMRFRTFSTSRQSHILERHLPNPSVFFSGNLRELSVRADGGREALTAMEWLSLLKPLISLRLLDINGAIYTDGLTRIDRHVQKVTLPALELIMFTGSFDQVNALIPYLEFHPRVRIDLTIYPGPSETALQQSLGLLGFSIKRIINIQSIDLHLHTLHATFSHHRVTVDIRSDASFYSPLSTFETISSQPSASSTDVPYSLRISNSMVDFTGIVSISRGLGAAFSNLDLGHIVIAGTVVVSPFRVPAFGHATSATAGIISVLEQAAHVHTLTFVAHDDRCASEQLLEVLSALPAWHTGVLLPQLATIEFRKIKSLTIIRYIHKALQNRRVAEILVSNACCPREVAMDFADLVKPYANNIEWDGNFDEDREENEYEEQEDKSSPVAGALSR